MMIVPPGSILTLKVTEEISTAFVLEGERGDVLLPKRLTERRLKIGDEETVFIYEDKQGRKTATAKIPSVTLQTYDWAEVAGSTEKTGVFVNIGLEKDVLVSSDNLPLHTSVWPVKGDQLFVCLDHDKKGRLIAKPVTESVIEKERDKAPADLKNQDISGYVYRAAKIGSFIITEEGFRAFVHHSQRRKEPRLGQWVKGRITEVKEDGTLNVSLLPPKEESRIEDADVILQFLQEQGGEMFLTDKSSPEKIKETFNLSKAAFKRALGKLMKDGVIEQKEGKSFLKNN